MDGTMWAKSKRLTQRSQRKGRERKGMQIWDAAP
jgi:hypothetical protein